jgi:hypothetical protein
MCFDDNRSDPPHLTESGPCGGTRNLGQEQGEAPMEQSHVSALQLKHAGLERQLAEEQNRPMPDIAIVQQLKKQKLRIKEELEHI